MYLKRFWIKNIQDKETYSINFIGSNDKIQRWSMFQGDDPSENLLVLKLISVCLGGGKKYFTSLGQQVVKNLISEYTSIFWGIDLYDDKFKICRIQFN